MLSNVRYAKLDLFLLLNYFVFLNVVVFIL